MNDWLLVFKYICVQVLEICLKAFCWRFNGQRCCNFNWRTGGKFLLWSNKKMKILVVVFVVGETKLSWLSFCGWVGANWSRIWRGASTSCEWLLTPDSSWTRAQSQLWPNRYCEKSVIFCGGPHFFEYGFEFWLLLRLDDHRHNNNNTCLLLMTWCWRIGSSNTDNENVYSYKIEIRD